MTNIQRYWPDIEGIGVRRAVMRPIPDDSHPDDEYVTYADHLAAIAAAREDAIAAAVQRVEAFEYVSTIGVTLSSVVPKASVIAAIKGDQP